MSQPQQSEAQELQLWLERVVDWSRSDSRETVRDACRLLSPLRDYLQRLLVHINSESSTAEIMKKLPHLGQFLGRLCWNHLVMADDSSRKSVLNCLWGLYSETPSNPVETKANQWIRRVLSRLVTEEEDVDLQTQLKHLDVSPEHYHHLVYKKMITQLQGVVERRCNVLHNEDQRCGCDSSLAASQTLIPLLGSPEAAPLIGALLRRPFTCTRAGLGEDFLEAVSSAYLSHSLSLDEAAVMSLWRQSLPSLEDALLTLLESSLGHRRATPQTLEQRVEESVLPKACARHCSVFLVVNDILRSVVMKQENCGVRRFIRTFTCCFLQELSLVSPQTRVSLKAFFPGAPPDLLLPLLTRPSETPQEAWTLHLDWIRGSLQRLTEQEDDRAVFEVWFLLVQSSWWLHVASQLLVTCGPEHSRSLLWLLTFYHHPTDRGHCRTQQLVLAEEAWLHTHDLFSASPRPPPEQQLEYFVARLSPLARQTPLSPGLILDLVVDAAVFCRTSGSTEAFATVVQRSRVEEEAELALESRRRFVSRANDGGAARLRVEALLDAVARSHADR